LHHTGFQSRRLNEVFGLAMGLPMLVSFYEYRFNHLKHHALLGTPENKEFFDYGDETWTIKGLASRFFMPRHYLSFLRNLLKALRGRQVGDYPSRYRRQVQSFYWISATMLGSLCIWCWIVGSAMPLLTWITSLLLVATPIHALIEMPEHFGCNTLSTNVFENTRTIRSNAFMRWFTNSNNFHVEHHRWPSVPLQRIHELHDQCRPQSRHFNISYWQFYTESHRGVPNRTEPT
jgi:fatty acid desaturase